MSNRCRRALWLTLMSLIQTHPPLAVRIAALQQ